MNSLLHILVLSAVEDRKTDTGYAYQTQTAECAVLKETGEVDQVGPLRMPRELVGKVTPGVYLGSFAFRRSNAKDGRGQLEAVLVGLQPYEIKAAAPKSATPAGGKS